MSNCFQDGEFAELGELMLAESDQRISQIPKDLCVPFHMEARRLDAELLAIYKMIVLRVRNEDDLDKVAEYWGTMVSICDGFSAKLNSLAEQHPYCGADSYYDKVLDLRNKCQRLQQMHM